MYTIISFISLLFLVLSISGNVYLWGSEINKCNYDHYGNLPVSTLTVNLPS